VERREPVTSLAQDPQDLGTSLGARTPHSVSCQALPGGSFNDPSKEVGLIRSTTGWPAWTFIATRWRCAGVGASRGGRTEKERFKTTTAGLAGMADWLGERDVALVAVEATGVY
jgi:hypothetical protein